MYKIQCTNCIFMYVQNVQVFFLEVVSANAIPLQAAHIMYIKYAQTVNVIFRKIHTHCKQNHLKEIIYS